MDDELGFVKIVAAGGQGEYSALVGGCHVWCKYAAGHTVFKPAGKLAFGKFSVPCIPVIICHIPRKELQSVAVRGCDEPAGGMGVVILLLLIIDEIMEHCGCFHVVAVNDLILTGHFGIIRTVEEQAPRAAPFFVKLMLEIVRVVLSLHHGIAHLRAVYDQPCYHVIVDGSEAGIRE